MLNTIPRPLWSRKRGVVGANSSLVVATIGKPNFSTLRFSISIFNESENKYYTSDLVVAKNGSDIVEVLSNKVNRSSLDVSVITTETALDYSLSIVSNEAFDLNVETALLTLKQ